LFPGPVGVSQTLTHADIRFACGFFILHLKFPMAAPEPDQDPETFSFSMKFGGEELSVSGQLPPHGAPATAMVPLFLGIGEALLAGSLRESGREGLVPSCGAGCGACCRQLVPISRTEAGYLRREILADLEGGHRRRVEQRIAVARERLESAGMLEELAALPEATDAAKRQALGLRYFLMGIACPFLENESCSIHPQRPLACREYLVTSPADHCASPGEGGVMPLNPRVKPSHALIRADAAATGEAGWMPMISALTATAPPAVRSIAVPRLELEGFLRLLGPA
jgi:Fe-S-cluster containining protein